ncbi:MAG: hypothetical protein ACLT46_03880 [Hungatella sp.]
MKIYSPNKEYTGVSASVPFCNGIGETDDPYLIGWFKSHGYRVEEEEPEKESEKEPEKESVVPETAEDEEESQKVSSSRGKSNQKKAGE